MKKVVLLDFWAAWCGPCKNMHPIIEEIEKKFADRVEVRKYNVDEPENENLMIKYQVQAMPTFIIEQDGQIYQSFVGAQSKTTLENALNQALEG